MRRPTWGGVGLARTKRRAGTSPLSRCLSGANAAAVSTIQMGCTGIRAAVIVSVDLTANAAMSHWLADTASEPLPPDIRTSPRKNELNSDPGFTRHDSARDGY